MPVTPDEFKELIPAPNTQICPKVIQLLVQLAVRTWELVSEMKNPDGTISDEFKAAIGLTVGGLAAPTNVAATDGGASSITITWSAVAGASSYKIYRNSVNDSSTASQIGSPSSTTFTDTSGITGTVYWYFLKATNAGGDSDFSTGDSGYWGGSSGNKIHFSASQTWTVPAGVTTIDLECWGGGGNGGGRNTSFLPVGANCGGGGGGGSGEYRIRSALAVTLGDEIVITIAELTSLDLVNNGSAGGTSAATRSSTILIQSNGGGGGLVGQPGAGGAGGAGGSGGSGGTSTSGNAGTAGATITTGGTGGAAVNSYGAGGTGHQTATQGGLGHVAITPHA